MARAPRRLTSRQAAAVAIAAEAALKADVLEARHAAGLAEVQSNHVRREQVLTTLRDGAMVTIKDLLVPHPEMHGRYTLKPIEELDDRVAWAIQSVSIKDTIDGQTIDIRLVDRVRIFENLGKFLNLWRGDGEVHKHLHVHGTGLQGVPDDQLMSRLKAIEADGVHTEQSVPP